ncbi:unnamed protein product [Victoria cruziana]
MATVMLVDEDDARVSGSDISMSQVPKKSLQTFVRPTVVSDFSIAIPLQSSEFIDTSPSVCTEKMRDVDSNKSLSLHNESPLRANELNPHAGGVFASNIPVTVLTMTDDGIHDFREINGGKRLSLATEIDMELDDASLCTKGETSDSVKAASVLPVAAINLCHPTAESLDLLASSSDTLFDKVTVQGVCESEKLLPHEESHIQENELNLETVDQQFSSNKTASALTVMDDDTTDFRTNSGSNSLAAEIGTKPDDNLFVCGEVVYCDSVKISAVNHFNEINFGEKEKDGVDFDYQHVSLNGRNNLEALEVPSHSDERLVDSAETFPVDDLVIPVLSFRFGFDNNSKSEYSMKDNHVKEDNALNMVEVNSSIPEDHCTNHEDCRTEKELEEHCKCDGLPVDNHVQSNVFSVKLDLEVQEVNYDNCICDGNSEVDGDKETQNAADIGPQCTCIIENQIIDGAPEMLLAMPQPGKQWSEETIQDVSTDSGNFAHSSLVEVSMLGGNNAEGVSPVIVDDHTYYERSLVIKHEQFYGSNLKTDGQANLEEADLGSDHISAFFLSENLFTPFSSHFLRKDGGTEWDPSLTTAELLQLSYSVVGKEVGRDVPYSVGNKDERSVCGTTDNLCMNHNMKGKEIDLTDPAEPVDSDNMHLADEHETCCVTNFAFDDGSSPITGYAAMTGEVEKDVSISSCSSGVDEIKEKPFEGNHLLVVYQMESDSATINYWLDRHDSLNFQDIGAEPSDTEMPRGVAEGQFGEVSKLNTNEKYKMKHTAEETVDAAKLDQEKASYTDETVGSEEELFTGSVDSSVSDSEHHDAEHSSYDVSSPLLGSQDEHSATSSTGDKQSAEACQFTASKSVGCDFKFRGASKLVDKFDECLAKESEEIRNDEMQPEQDRYSDNILTCKRPSFQECCGVWDWLRGYRGERST